MSKRIPILFILVLLLNTLIFTQDDKVNRDKRLRERILAAYQSGGEQELRDFVGKNNDEITTKFIVALAEAGSIQRKEEWLNVCNILAEEKKDEKTLADVFYYAGEYFKFISENKKALDCFNKALPIYTKRNVPVDRASVYNAMGVVLSRLGDNIKALEMYDKALPVFENMGMLRAQGNVYLGKGMVYTATCDYSKALGLLDKALRFFEKVGDLIGQGNAYDGKADILYISGNKLNAHELLDKALPFFEQAGDLIGQGNVFFGKGVIYSNRGEYTGALELLDKALPFYEKTGQLHGQGNIYYRKGEIYLRLGEHTRALKMFDKALPFFEQAGEPFAQGRVYYGKAVIYSHRSKKSRTLKMLDKTLFFFRKAGSIGAESDALHSKAVFLGQLGRDDEAMEFFENSIAKQDRALTRSAFPPDMKKIYMEKSYKQYEETAVFMLDNKYKKNGFEYTEAMKARVFLEQMAEGLVKLDKGLPTGLKEKRDELTARLSILSKRIHGSYGEKEKILRELKEQYRKTESEFEDLLVNIRVNNPMYASVRYPKPITIRTLQTEVLKKNEILVRYFISPYKLYVFIISKKKFKVVCIKVWENEIKSLVDRCLSAIKENSMKNIYKYGNTLYQKVFKPIEKNLKSNKDIIIIPHGDLAKIPFECLLLDDNHILIETYRVKYVQSASLLSMLRKYYTREGDAKSFIGFGDPVYDYENFNLGKSEQGAVTRSSEENDEIRGIYRSRYARAGGIMNRIQAGGEEIKTIAQLFKKASQKNVVQLREQATEDNAKAPQMKDFDFIHFACHGLLNDDFQSLVLSQLPSAKSQEDGYFTLNEIMNCDYNAKLVVLSACQTGSGKMYKGEGVTGLTRAVMYAGTPAVVASLWDVDDRATKELMVRFYRNMLEKNMVKTEALRQAKLELLRTNKYASPLFWSAFVMYGE